MSDRIPPHKAIILTDGRRISYAEFGQASGIPVFYFHGGGMGSRLMAKNLEKAALTIGARLIAPDRPGIGLSTFQRRRTIKDWPRDLLEIAHALKLDQFAVVSESAGSPYVIACAAQIPERLISAGIVSGVSPNIPHVMRTMAPQYRLTNTLLSLAPFWLARMMISPMAQTLKHNPQQFFEQAIAGMPPADLEVAADPTYREIALRCFQEAYRQGVDGPAWDIRLGSRPWKIALAKITMEIQLWHGTADRSAPLAMALYLKETLPHCRANIYPEEGHISVFYRHSREILADLIAER